MRTRILLVIALLLFANSAFAANCTSVSQNGITWTLNASVECGQFVNGDWWVVAPVAINSQSPAWDGAKNGAMLDPTAGSNTHGYDNRVTYGTTFDNSYRQSFPVTISSGIKSLVSVIGTASYDPVGGENSFVDNAAVLTIVNSAPAAGSFRPQYVSGTKFIYDNSAINYSLVPSFTAPASTPNLTAVMRMPWLNYGGKTFGEENYFPTNDTPGDSGYPLYGPTKYGSVLSLVMLLNTANRVSYINKMIQLGIDDYGVAQGNDFAWVAAGGYGNLHLFPILFAGAMLDNVSLKSVGQYTSTYPLAHKFAEKGWTYYNDNNVVMFGSEECLSGLSTWQSCTSNCMCRDPDGILFPEDMPNGGGYRITSSYNLVGESLAMRILEPTLGLATLFNHPAFFDYIDYWIAHPEDWTNSSTDRYKEIYGYGGSDAIGAGSGNYFMTDMWGTYSASYPYDATDTTPYSFSFTDNTGVSPSTVIYSTSVQVLGVDDNTSIASSSTGCSYQVNGAGSWLTTGGDNVSLNDNVAMKVTSSPNYSTDTPCVLTLNGNVSDTWHVTTQAAVEDTFPPVPARGRFQGRGRWR